MLQVDEGETILIPCKDRIAPILDRENPSAKVSWIHNGKSVRIDGKRIILESGNNLKVMTVPEDNGLWWCSIALTSKVRLRTLRIFYFPSET